MSERTAVVLVMAAMAVAVVGAGLGLKILGANDQWVALAFVLILVAGAYLVSCVVMHYGSSDRG